MLWMCNEFVPPTPTMEIYQCGRKDNCFITCNVLIILSAICITPEGEVSIYGSPSFYLFLMLPCPLSSTQRRFNADLRIKATNGLLFYLLAPYCFYLLVAYSYIFLGVLRCARLQDLSPWKFQLLNLGPNIVDSRHRQYMYIIYTHNEINERELFVFRCYRTFSSGNF